MTEKAEPGDIRSAGHAEFPGKFAGASIEAFHPLNDLGDIGRICFTILERRGCGPKP